jgi:hypothetical protein
LRSCRRLRPAARPSSRRCTANRVRVRGLNAVFDEVPVLGLVAALTRKFYFVTVTNTSIVVNNANRFTNSPGEIVAVFPREAGPIRR